MLHTSYIKSVVACIALLVFIVLGSLFSMQLWGGKPEKMPTEKDLVIQDEMTLQEFGAQNQLSTTNSRQSRSVFRILFVTKMSKKLVTFDA